MKRSTVLNDQIQHIVATIQEALTGISTPGYEYDLCATTALEGMQQLTRLHNEFQYHLDAGTLLEEIEVYTKTVWDKQPYALVEYWRLLPGSTIPTSLSGYRGFFDFLDAEKERAQQWSNAVYVSPGCFDNAVATYHASCELDDMYPVYFAHTTME